MKMLLLTISSLLTSMFMQSNHPLIMGLILLMQTITLCMLSGMISQTFWFSYILFLIFLGGMLVLFIYVTSIASNEIASMSNKMIIMVLVIPTTVYLLMEINPMKNQENSGMMITDPMINTFIKMYNMPNKLMIIMMAIYLFLTLIAVVKITEIFQGPLRKNN
uniref:NADH dehydrogenase subunit 6 n=1 Tax=Chorisoserrata biceps TaxID=3037039 RepID=UPI0027A66C3B|nr:NADH dehydrogenase subunit 6 [Chorisoserrata biceps]WGO57194.1 NADH dehydrogenase subunit 6 [Chorisoserrata biceps]